MCPISAKDFNSEKDLFLDENRQKVALEKHFSKGCNQFLFIYVVTVFEKRKWWKPEPNNNFGSVSSDTRAIVFYKKTNLRFFYLDP